MLGSVANGFCSSDHPFINASAFVHEAKVYPRLSWEYGADSSRLLRACCYGTSIFYLSLIKESDMKYLLALVACFGILVVYVIIAGVMGWKPGASGAIPMIILISALFGTWRAITKKGDGK